jgi:UDP-N-acetylmuramoyl-tripeptide--D-alanyl-D-alanine ligase
VAVVTNALLAHVEGFGSLQGIAHAKGEIYQNLNESGVAVLNWDDAQKDIWLQNIGKRKIVRFAVNNHGAQELQQLSKQGVEFIATDLIEQSDGTVTFQLLTAEGGIAIRLQLLGKHNVANAVAAAACAHSVGISIEDIKKGLERSRAVSGRMQAHTGINGAIVIDDSYNANPGSVKAAIDSLVRWQGNSVLVLGDLAELGAGSQEMHDELGRYAKAAGIKHIFATGQFTRGTCDTFGQGAEHFVDHQAIVQRLKTLLDKDTVVLVKGSRSAHMESVVAEIVGQ